MLQIKIVPELIEVEIGSDLTQAELAERRRINVAIPNRTRSVLTLRLPGSLVYTACLRVESSPGAACSSEASSCFHIGCAMLIIDILVKVARGVDEVGCKGQCNVFAVLLR